MVQEILPNGPVGVKMAKFAISKGTEVDITSGGGLLCPGHLEIAFKFDWVTMQLPFL